MKNLHVISVTYLRKNLAEILERTASGGQFFLVCKYGEPKVIFCPPSTFKKEVNKSKKLDKKIES